MSALGAHARLGARVPNAAARARTCSVRRVAPLRASSTTVGSELVDWLKENGANVDSVEVRTLDVPAAGRPLDVVVAREALAPGEVAMAIPEHLVLTLDRIFESEFVAEVLTTDKLSEMACLALFLMYEKKMGKASFWHPFIKELDKQRARGPQAVESTLLWSDTELDSLLRGSPLVGATRGRLASLRKEYEALDTVWFMAGSLFNKYPFEVPTEAFSFERFAQAFAAVQAALVHLQGVPIAKRFALVPLGPPLLAYSSTAKSMLSYDEASRSVRLVAAAPLAPGQPLSAWCGPQPNAKLLLNYGIVDEHNPFDKLQFTFTLSTSDPLFQLKRARLTEAGLASQQAFDVSASKPLPPAMVPYMALALAGSPEQVAAVSFAEGGPAAPPELMAAALAALAAYTSRRQQAYAHPLWRDLEILADSRATPREKVAARLTKVEKSILAACLDALKARGAPAEDAAALRAGEQRMAAVGLRAGDLQDGQGHCG